MTSKLVKVTESEVCLARRGEAEEGWISSSWLYVLLVFKYLKEGEQCKDKNDFSNRAVLKRCEHMDLQDGHR